MTLYDEKMPGYLVMSRGDLIAEILEHGAPMQKWLGEQRDEVEGDGGMFGMTGNLAEPPADVETSARTMTIANDVLRARFGLTIEFHTLPE